MKITKTQPLEHTNPVVPETEATVDDDAAITNDKHRDPKRDAGREPNGDVERGEDSTPGSDESTDGHAHETYPEAPAGSAGHP